MAGKVEGEVIGPIAPGEGRFDEGLVVIAYGCNSGYYFITYYNKAWVRRF